MGGGTQAQASARARLHARLRGRREEIEDATFTRVCAIADPAEIAEPSYLDGLRSAVSAALDFGFEALQRGPERPPEIPLALLAQARLAARSGVSLDTVLRRYFAGYAVFGDYLVESGDGALGDAELKELLRSQAAVLDRLLAAVSEEFERERAGARPQTSEQRRTHLVERLLHGELGEHTALAGELAYDLDVCHLGVAATGPGGREAIGALAGDLDCRLLLIRRPEQTVWGWLGTRQPLDPAGLKAIATSSAERGTALALGEPARGLAGWRLSHRQAIAAIAVARRGATPVVRYADVALLASALQDDLLATSLRRLYLDPLERGRNGGGVARETLRAYFAAGRHVSSAAAALGVKRHTVTNRLREIESSLEHALDAGATELELALCLEELSARQS